MITVIKRRLLRELRKPQEPHLGYKCENCGVEIDYKKVKLHHPPMPNAVGNLPDHGITEWFCPNCQFWNSSRGNDDDQD